MIIAPDDVRPVDIANSHLFVSKPKAASVSPESSAVTVAGNNNGTAPATHGALLSNAEVPEVTNFQIQGPTCRSRLKRSFPSLSS